MPAFSLPYASPVIIATPPAALSSVPAGAYIGVTRKTLSNWRALGEGPPYARLGASGARIVYRVADLDQFLAEHMVGVVR
ncbi:helix-turn-helix domain-containing protein [Cryobacterium sp. 5B3]|uniref:helix-turn-helix transcriptional regulator n=1 Tax=Cryobacterium sp. 5B3 TaxID=3048586 RepID=UPI002AB42EB7|nr:helix-turn-helix domain-containing protein [Cryobacterium sp. 5B3]MDY7541770.1 helix-turn-helix domain-containing protein [Cryobacterium sp. 5B3]MEB0275250.1 helix-turn-helix domain-containing protein [Cryobacterium sp. 5B3]